MRQVRSENTTGHIISFILPGTIMNCAFMVADRPMEGFRFAGTLISNGDLFLNGNTDEEHAANYIGEQSWRSVET